MKDRLGNQVWWRCAFANATVPGLVSLNLEFVCSAIEVQSSASQ